VWKVAAANTPDEGLIRLCVKDGKVCGVNVQ
jgi:hypothetical protein